MSDLAERGFTVADDLDGPHGYRPAPGERLLPEQPCAHEAAVRAHERNEHRMLWEPYGGPRGPEGWNYATAPMKEAA